MCWKDLRAKSAYLKSGNYKAAINGFEGIKKDFSYRRFLNSHLSVKLHYYLGIAYENDNQNESAIREYSKFLKSWQDADADLKTIDDAGKRLTRLQNQF